MKYKIVIIIGVALLMVLSLSFWFKAISLKGTSSEQNEETSSAVDLGVTYLPLTAQVASCYDLGVNSGALVTGITPDSTAERAGLKTGDVIISFNGVGVGREAQLLKMMRDCPAGSQISLEVWREGNIQMIEFVHTRK